MKNSDMSVLSHLAFLMGTSSGKVVWYRPCPSSSVSTLRSPIESVQTSRLAEGTEKSASPSASEKDGSRAAYSVWVGLKGVAQRNEEN